METIDLKTELINLEHEEMIRLSTIFSEILGTPYALFNHKKECFIFMTKIFCDITHTWLAPDQFAAKSNQYMGIIHPKDFDIHLRVNSKIKELISEIYSKNPFAKVFTNSIYRIRSGENKYDYANVFMRPIKSIVEGNLNLHMVFFKPAKRKGYDRFVLYFIDGEKQLYYSSLRDEFVSRENVELKKIEIEILQMISQGLREPQIAKRLEIKIDLVRYYKKSIFRKLHVSNIAEAVYIGSFYEIL